MQNLNRVNLVNLLNSKKSYSYLALCLAGITQQAYGMTDPLKSELSRLKNQEIYQNTEEQIQKAERFLENKSSLSKNKQTVAQNEKGQYQKITKINIDFSGESAKLDFSPVIKQYEGTPLNRKQIFALVKDLTQVLSDSGYSTSGIAFKNQDFKEGVLDFIILWGKVDNILINGKPAESFRDKAMLATLPPLKNQLFNIYTLDQVIEIMNTQNKSVQVKVQPGKLNGTSDLNLQKSTHYLPSITLGANNSGTENNQNGRNQLTTAIAWSDLLGTNDSWSFSVGHRLYKKSRRNNQNNYALNYTQPFSFYILETKLSESGYKKEVSGINTYTLKGKTKTANIKLSRTLLRNRESILSLFGELEFKHRRSYLAQLLVGNYHNNKLTTGIAYVGNLGNGKLYTDISYSTGLNWFNANKSAYDKSGDKTSRLFSGSVTWHRPFSLGKQNLNYQFRLGAQYSLDSLYSDYQFSIGDEYTVRGFKGGVASGDSGAYLSQTVTMPFYPQKTYLTSISPFIGLDIGKTYQKLASQTASIEGKNKTLLGSAIGVKMLVKNFSLAFTYSQPLYTKNIPNKKSPEYYFNGSIFF
ncbi:transporter [Pasteurellaceae bacterium Macca]|nr:transporter [Pasteurellaceae bacterium Macca]